VTANNVTARVMSSLPEEILTRPGLVRPERRKRTADEVTPSRILQ
jgi:hypothetical protein